MNSIIHFPVRATPPSTTIGRTRAANTNAVKDEVLDHRAVVERLYRELAPKLRLAAERIIDNPSDADDVVQEAFAELLSRSEKTPTRAAVYAIVRDLARGRRAERANWDEYVEDEEPLHDDAAAWLSRALQG